MATDQNSEVSSTRPYLVRALHEWCCDNGFTPYITVFVDASVQVPLEYVENDEVVLNVGFDATTALRMNNDYLEFKARFAGVVREIVIPMDHVVAIFSRENGQGMAFPKPEGFVTKRLGDQGAPRPAVSLAMASSMTSKESLRKTAEPEHGVASDDAIGTESATTLSTKPRPALTRVK